SYPFLEQHFSSTHYACQHAVCRERKFVVFGSEIELKAHTLEAHGDDMSKGDMRGARRVLLDPGPSRDGAGRGQGQQINRGQQVNQPGSGPGPGRADGRHTGHDPGPPPGRRREFGGALSGSQDSSIQAPAPSLASSPAIISALRSYQHNESTAGDLVGVVWASVENSGSGTKSLDTANALIAAFELEGEKREELGRVWGAFLREQTRLRPELATRPAAILTSIPPASTIPSANSFTPLISRPAAQNQVWEDREFSPHA
ncbi:hypothetical protein C8J56DRAFT_1126809, partial [Mycena floridula]